MLKFKSEQTKLRFVSGRNSQLVADGEGGDSCATKSVFKRLLLKYSASPSSIVEESGQPGMPGETATGETAVIRVKPEPSTVQDDKAPGEQPNELALPNAPTDDLQIVSHLGSGGMGSVYKAYHKGIDKTLAVKMLHSKLASDAQLVKRFEQEAKAASLLTHENLAAVYDFGISANGEPYLIMDYIDGVTLQDVLKAEPNLPIAKFLHIFKQVCDALSHAHSKQLIHRDLKPANIMLVNSPTDTDLVKIVDFGIAKILPQANTDEERLTQTGEVLGSPVYMCPEQCVGHPPDARGDVYSLGCVMYEALAGRPPFLRDNVVRTILSHLNDSPAPFAESAPQAFISHEVEQVVFKCLEKNPDKRYQSIDELRDALELFDKDTSAPGKQIIVDKLRKAKLNLLLKKQGSSIFLGLVASFAVSTAGALAFINYSQEAAFLGCIDLAKQNAYKNVTDFKNYRNAAPLWRKAIAMSEQLGKPRQTTANLCFELAHSCVQGDPNMRQERRGAYEKALRLLKKNSGSPFLYDSLVAMKRDDLTQYVQHIRRKNDPEAEQLEKLLEKGTTASKNGQFEQATMTFEEALKLDRDYSPIRLGLGEACAARALKSSDSNEQLRLLHHAVFLNGSTESFKLALAKVIQSVNKDPHSYRERVALGEAAIKAGDVEGGVVEYLAALELQAEPKLEALVRQLYEKVVEANVTTGRSFYNNQDDERVPGLEAMMAEIGSKQEDVPKGSGKTTELAEPKQKQNLNLSFREIPAAPIDMLFNGGSNGRVFSELAQCYSRQGRWAESEFAYKLALLDDPSNVMDVCIDDFVPGWGAVVTPRLGEILMKRAKYSEAAQLYKTIIEHMSWSGPGDYDILVLEHYIEALGKSNRNEHADAAWRLLNSRRAAQKARNEKLKLIGGAPSEDSFSGYACGSSGGFGWSSNVQTQL